MAITLLEAGLAKLQTSFGSDRIPDFHLLEQAEQSAKKQKLRVRRSQIMLGIATVILLFTVLKRFILQIWENYVEGEEVSNGVPAENKQQEVLKVLSILLYYKWPFFLYRKMLNDLPHCYMFLGVSNRSIGWR